MKDIKALAQEIVKGLVPYFVGVRNETKAVNETLTKMVDEVKKKSEYETEIEVEIDDNLRQELKGKDGETPIKGKDYFTTEEIQEMVDKIVVLVTPVLGVDYYTVEEKQQLIEEIQSQIEKPNDGVDGEDGADGYTPVKGKDYFTAEDIALIVETIIPLVLAKVPKVKGQDILDALRKLPKSKGLQIKDIYGLSQILGAIGVNSGGGRSGPSSGSTGLAETFETVSSNLKVYDYTINYNGSGDVSSIVYDLGGGLSITKTINYNGSGDVTSIVLSGNTPTAIDLTKTFTYTSGNITSVAYSV